MTYKDLFRIEAPESNYQDVKHKIGELKKQIAELYRSIGDNEAADTIFPPDNTAVLDSIGAVL